MQVFKLLIKHVNQNVFFILQKKYSFIIYMYDNKQSLQNYLKEFRKKIVVCFLFKCLYTHLQLIIKLI